MKAVFLVLLISLALCNHSKHHVKQCPCDQQGCPSCMLGNAIRQSHEQAEQLVKKYIKEFGRIHRTEEIC